MLMHAYISNINTIDSFEISHLLSIAVEKGKTMKVEIEIRP